MSQFSQPHTINKFQKSLNDFRSARQRAAMEHIVARLTGKSNVLLSYTDVADKLKIVNQANRGVRDIPVEAIVGSVGRYTDFSRTFLPMLENDATRWARVASVADFSQLPPIDVYQVGDVYFVLDGNHRVSIARQRGILFIPAEVTEVQTRAPIPPDVSPDKLILQAEYVSFLENTNLDRLRPNAHLRVSVPGQYRKLENHMEVHRFFIEMANEIELSDEQAITRWHDEAYWPVIEAVREQGILRSFPNRTETDMYIWIYEHQAYLRNELGWQVRPEVAAADLVGKMTRKAESLVTRLGKKIGRLILNPAVSKRPGFNSEAKSWSQSKVAARYSEHLFSDLLVVFMENFDNQSILDQALIIAALDGSQLHGLSVMDDGSSPQKASEMQESTSPGLKSWFEEKCQAADVEGRLAQQTGQAVELICARAVLTDLIIYGRQEKGTKTQQLTDLIRQSPRPILIAAEKSALLQKVLLAYDGDSKSKEALFAAAYMAEIWGVLLTVVLASQDEEAGKTIFEHARNYLEMHEVEAEYIICSDDPVDLIIGTAQEKGIQLIVAGGYDEQRFGRLGSGKVVNQLIMTWPGALLICP